MEQRKFFTLILATQLLMMGTGASAQKVCHHGGEQEACWRH